MLSSICFSLETQLIGYSYLNELNPVKDEYITYPISKANLIFHASDYKDKTLVVIRPRGTYTFVSNGIDWTPVE